jgi:hypothetical protein
MVVTDSTPYELFTIHIDRVYESNMVMVQVNNHVTDECLILDKPFPLSPEGLKEICKELEKIIL